MNNITLIEGIDYVEFYVGNAFQTALFYQHFWGFELIAYCGFETGNNETVSYVLRQEKITLVVTGSLNPDNSIARHVAVHGDGVKNIAFRVSSSSQAYDRAVRAGALSERGVTQLQDKDGSIKESAVKVYGDTIHSFIERKNYSGSFMPGFKENNGSIRVISTGLHTIDHITANVEVGTLDFWIEFYQKAFNFKMHIYFDENDIFTQHAAMASKVVMNEDESIKLPLTVPVNKLRNSQIQEFINYNRGSGIQHLAFTTNNIVKTIEQLKNRGIEFLKIPDEYYQMLDKEIINSEEKFDDLKRLQIMIDKENKGFLLQAFTKPVLDRPTYFIELIQRKGATSFGKGNVKALFNALEVEQQKRKNL